MTRSEVWSLIKSDTKRDPAGKLVTTTLLGDVTGIRRPLDCRVRHWRYRMETRNCDECKHFNDEDVPGARVC